MERSAPFDVGLDGEDEPLHGGLVVAGADDLERLHQRNARGEHGGELAAEDGDIARIEDRKSTRLNSSHSQISYAVFCLKKKMYDEVQWIVENMRPLRAALRETS